MNAYPYLPDAVLKQFRETEGAAQWVREFWYCKGIQRRDQSLKGMCNAVDELQKLGFFQTEAAGVAMPTVDQVEGYVDGDGRKTVPSAAKAATTHPVH